MTLKQKRVLVVLGLVAGAIFVLLTWLVVSDRQTTLLSEERTGTARLVTVPTSSHTATVTPSATRQLENTIQVVSSTPSETTLPKATDLVPTFTSTPLPTSTDTPTVTPIFTSSPTPMPTRTSVPSPTPTLSSTPVQLLTPTPDWISPFGVETHNYDLLPLAAQAQMSWLRVSMSWAQIEPQNVLPGKEDGYNWKPYDERLLKAAKAHLTPIVYIWRTPSWAVSEPDQDPHHCHFPQDMQFLYDMLTDVVERYHKPPYGVKYWEIYNEPEGHIDGYIGCMGDNVSAYVDMLRIAHSAIKTVDPDAKILLGGLAMLDEPATNPHFLEQVMALGGGDYFDIVSFHAYSEQYAAPYTWFETPQGELKGLRGKAAIIRNVLSAYPEYADKSLMLTEVAKRCFPKEEICDASELEEQSRYVVYENIRGMAAGLDAIIWFTLEYPGFYHSGLMDENQNPKSAYEAYVTLGQEMYGAQFEREMTLEETGDARVEGYVFTMPGGWKKWVLWTLEEVSLQVHFPGSLNRLNVVDKYGHETVMTDEQDRGLANDNLISVQASRDPLYIEPLP